MLGDPVGWKALQLAHQALIAKQAAPHRKQLWWALVPQRLEHILDEVSAMRPAASHPQYPGLLVWEQFSELAHCASR
jgi:hypothetical protein